MGKHSTNPTQKSEKEYVHDKKIDSHKHASTVRSCNTRSKLVFLRFGHFWIATYQLKLVKYLHLVLL